LIGKSDKPKTDKEKEKMAKYDIVYACGCEDVKVLFGKNSERERKIKWFETICCPKCEAEFAAQKASEKGLPTLDGSEKQVSWALKIRQDFISKLESVKSSTSILIDEELKTLLVGTISGIMENELAKFWIDNRDKNVTDLITDECIKNEPFVRRLESFATNKDVSDRDMVWIFVRRFCK
jgi:hypothetical protein